MAKSDLSISEEHDGRLVRVVIARPERRNALRAQTFRELFALFDRLRSDARCTVLTITGGGDRAFCAGADIEEISGLEPHEFRAFCQNTIELYRRMRALRQIVVASVNGAAYGAGCALAMASDLVIADARARFAQPEIRVGILGGSALLPRHLSNPRLAAEMVLTGRSISADEAERYGLVNRVTSADGLTAETDEMIATLLALPAGALALAKQALVRGDAVPDAIAAFEIQQDLATAAFALPERAERMQAFLSRTDDRPKARG
ncbi:enoyl-CoA hydratase/isomerase family protein [Oceanibacterium hippocampi]|uniref:enoyl-CoA hydratase/isomerase family protein n=1 Tax=Oceanibacterium hippocampi TaxID=745714 RepID=UPI0015938F42|nr:enoyl-CoA hydratase/isomerase family protein [Oceanibacterium hippocampi]